MLCCLVEADRFANLVLGRRVGEDLCSTPGQEIEFLVCGNEVGAAIVCIEDGVGKILLGTDLLIHDMLVSLFVRVIKRLSVIEVPVRQIHDRDGGVNHGDDEEEIPEDSHLPFFFNGR